MKSGDRLLRLQQLIQEAEKLAQEEAHLQYNDRRLTRLAAVLWVSRDVVDEVIEQQIHGGPPEGEGGGRPKRDHT